MTTFLMPLYKGVTHLDFTGPHQFLTKVPGAEVIVASLDGAPVESHGLTFSNLAKLSMVERCDVLCIPGGLGCIAAIEDAAFLEAIRRLAATATYVTSICTGSLILAAAGILKGRRAASHWAWREMLADFGAIPDSGRVVRDGNIITGGGVTAGIDFALTLIAELHGIGTAQTIQLQLEYAPAPPFESGLPETAPPAIRDAVIAQMAAGLAESRRRVRKVAVQLQEKAASASL